MKVECGTEEWIKRTAHSHKAFRRSWDAEFMAEKRVTWINIFESDACCYTY